MAERKRRADPEHTAVALRHAPHTFPSASDGSAADKSLLPVVMADAAVECMPFPLDCAPPDLASCCSDLCADGPLKAPPLPVLPASA